MKSIKDLVGQRAAVRTETQEDFDLVCKTLDYEFKADEPWERNEDDTCISLFAKKFGAERIFSNKGFDIYELSDFSEFQSTHPADIDEDDEDDYDVDDDLDLDDDDIDDDGNPFEDEPTPETVEPETVKEEAPKEDNSSKIKGLLEGIKSLTDMEEEGIEINIRISNSALQIILDKA
jgi:hypothetical protein